MIDPDGAAGGPAYDGGSESGLSYTTYAQEPQAAGVTWKVYQAYDNYGDNALEYFDQFQNLSSSSPLYPGVGQTGGSSGDIATILAHGITADLKAGTFPQVSSIVTNQQYSEHPYTPPNDGAHCINLILQALAAYPSVFNSSVLFLNYDENDGLFDHVPPPVAPAGTALEYIPGTNSATENLPIGLGLRVPMTNRGGRLQPDADRPERFRRDFKGNSTTAGASVSAALSYQETVSANTTDLALTLANRLAAAAIFTITANHYTSGTLTESVAAGATWSGDVTAAFTASGWYDFTITVSADASWSQRFAGHLENEPTSVTG
jgi:hypothetical protein